MSKGLMLVTGATGMVGSAVARRALEAGYRVRALVRDAKRVDLLAGLDVELCEGDLAKPETLPAAFDNVEYVVHAAAHVGDWGPAELYRAINVVALEHMLVAAARQPNFKRWVQISSLGIYPARHHHGTDESTPADLEGLDGYTRTKAEAEHVLHRQMKRYQLPAVILRPGFIYGVGDRHVLPRLIENIQAGKMKLIGDGQKLLNNTAVENLVDAVMLSLENEAALGETFNIRDERLVTRVEFVGTVCDYLDKPHPKHVPEGVARVAAGVIERIAKWRGRKTAPVLTKARLKFLTLNLDFSIEKAKSKLGYQPKVDFRDGMKEALDWAVREKRQQDLAATTTAS